MSPTLDFGAYSDTEMRSLLTAAKAEMLRRLTGRVASGSSAAQSYSFTQMTVAELTNLINGLTDALGLSTVNARVMPNFNQSAWPPAFSTSETSDVQTNSFHETTTAGNVIVAPSSPNHTEVVSIASDVAGTKIVAIQTTGNYQRGNGDIVRLRLSNPPLIAGITIEIRSGSYGGTLLYSYTTDGSGADAAAFDLYFDGSSYQRFQNAVPVV